MTTHRELFQKYPIFMDFAPTEPVSAVMYFESLLGTEVPVSGHELITNVRFQCPVCGAITQSRVTSISYFSVMNELETHLDKCLLDSPEPGRKVPSNHSSGTAIDANALKKTFSTLTISSARARARARGITPTEISIDESFRPIVRPKDPLSEVRAFDSKASSDYVRKLINVAFDVDYDDIDMVERQVIAEESIWWELFEDPKTTHSVYYFLEYIGLLTGKHYLHDVPPRRQDTLKNQPARVRPGNLFTVPRIIGSLFKKGEPVVLPHNGRVIENWKVWV